MLLNQIGPGGGGHQSSICVRLIVGIQLQLWIITNTERKKKVWVNFIGVEIIW